MDPPPVEDTTLTIVLVLIFCFLVWYRAVRKQEEITGRDLLLAASLLLNVGLLFTLSTSCSPTTPPVPHRRLAASIIRTAKSHQHRRLQQKEECDPFSLNNDWKGIYGKLRCGEQQDAAWWSERMSEQLENCGSFLLCSYPKGSRNRLTGMTHWNSSMMHAIPATSMPLHVPIVKSPRDPSRGLGKDVKLEGAGDDRILHLDDSPQVFAPWPQRKNMDAIDWRRFPDGKAWQKCQKSLNPTETHFFCTHLQKHVGEGAAHSLDVTKALFKRGDVRLVLDLGGSTGSFCSEVHHSFGDRIVCITGEMLFPPPNREHERKLLWSPHQVSAARGLPSVVVDAMSYLPFGESTLDVLHSSWLFHTGVPPLALYEVYRVLRPGGYFIIRLPWNPLKSMNGQAATEMAREAYKHLTEEAAKLYMRKIFFAGAVGRAGSMIVFQMPVSEEWTGYKPGASS